MVGELHLDEILHACLKSVFPFVHCIDSVIGRWITNFVCSVLFGFLLCRLRCVLKTRPTTNIIVKELKKKKQSYLT
jgi:hypothetical protein